MEQSLQEFYKALDRRYGEGDLRAVEQFLLEQARNCQAGPSPLMIAVYNEMGSFYRGVSRYRESAAAFQVSREEIALRVGCGSMEYATVLNNMAGTYRLAGHPDKAVALFREAIGIYQQNHAEKTYPYASVLNNIALAYRETGEIGSAISCLEEALALIQEMPDHRHEVAVTCSNLTALCFRAGQRERARVYLDQAMELFAACEDSENVHYAAALNSLGGIMYADRDWERALEAYEQAAAYTKRFFGENEEYAITHQNMSWVYRKQGDPERAAEALRTAHRVCMQLFGPDHERTRAIAAELRTLERTAV